MNKQPALPIDPVHSSWRSIVLKALGQMDQSYLQRLLDEPDWLPGLNNCLNAFSQPLPLTRYILIGESPYPRSDSANGYAFWDARVDKIWSETGLTKTVNRATSLRHFIKMLLVARGDLTTHTSQMDIAKLNKRDLVQTLGDLFQNMIEHGFLLLNASLVLSARSVSQETKSWKPFMQSVLADCHATVPNCELLLFGKLAHNIQALAPKDMPVLISEHPYNVSFIHNPSVIACFQPLDLLMARQ